MMMEAGTLVCPDLAEDPTYCPSGCSICDTCLTLLGCAQTRPENPLREMFNLTMLLYILAAVVGIILGIMAMTVNKRNKAEKPLNENLVDGAGAPGGDDNVWLAPVS